jgi:hypothetical protein
MGLGANSPKVIILLSVLIPVGLFAGFKLTGMIGGPLSVAETVRLQPAIWTREEPYNEPQIPGDPFLNTSYVGEDVALAVSHYCAGGFFNPSDSIMGVAFLSSFGIPDLKASVPKGFIVSVEVAYKEAYPNSSAELFPDEQGPEAYGNLTLFTAADKFHNPQALGENKLYLKAIAVGQPREVYFKNFYITYLLSSPYNYTHQITIETIVTYFNGTVYKQLIQPVELVLGPDHNNSFEDAEEIGFGLTHQYYVDDSVNGDPVDYFKISLQEGQKVTISVLIPEGNKLYPPISGLNPDVFVYDPNRNLEASLFLPGSNLHAHNATSQIVLNVNMTGWWYVKVTTTFSYSLYALNVTLVSS